MWYAKTVKKGPETRGHSTFGHFMLVYKDTRPSNSHWTDILSLLLPYILKLNETNW